MRVLVGIDDTDNLESRGTGYRARQLGELCAREGFAVLGVTRHQLFVDPRIPYTSHNSSACLEVEAPHGDTDRLIALGRIYLLDESAPGSDAGLCVLPIDGVGGPIVGFGGRAKQAVVTRDEAEQLARQAHAHLEGLTGTGIGVIGALAAVGLRAGANDGRFLWLPRLRELTGVHTAAALRDTLRLDAIETEAGAVPRATDRIGIGEWPRPILRHGRRVLLIEEAQSEDHDWIVAAKERIKQLSD